MDPCGTPQVNGRAIESSPPTIKNCFHGVNTT